jgi:hypothetical protein
MAGRNVRLVDEPPEAWALLLAFLMLALLIGLCSKVAMESQSASSGICLT